MRVVFFGIDAPYSIIPLLAIREKFDVVAVMSSGKEKKSFNAGLKDFVKKVAGRKSNQSNSLEHTCNIYGIPYHYYPSINSDAAINELKLLNPDVICMSGFNEKLNGGIIQIPVHGVFNAHSSLLPFYRGANQFFWMIKDNNFKTGCTIHKVNEEFDAGEIVASESINIYEGMNPGIYNILVASKAAQLFINMLEVLKINKLILSPNEKQNEFQCKNPVQSDFIIDHNYTLKKALWLFNAYGTTVQPMVQLDNEIKRCLKLSSKKFESGTEFSLADGKIYILTD